MENKTKIEFKLKGKVNGETITPDTLDITEVQKYLSDVSKFIFADGSIPKNKDKREAISIHYKEGSAKLLAFIPFLFAPNLQADLEAISSKRFDRINPKRLEVVNMWQQRCIETDDIAYSIKIENSETTLEINNQTDYREVLDDIYLEEEVNFYGIINNIGGKSTTNIHLDTVDYGQIVIDIPKSIVQDDKKNRLYKKYKIIAKVHKNLLTGELKEKRGTFISWEEQKTKFDSDRFDEYIKNTTPIFKDLPDNWVRDIRGEL